MSIQYTASNARINKSARFGSANHNDFCIIVFVGGDVAFTGYNQRVSGDYRIVEGKGRG